MCFTFVWHIEPRSFFFGFSTDKAIPHNPLSYSPWFMVNGGILLRCCVYDDGWELCRSDESLEFDVEYETSLDPDANTPQATNILKKGSLSGPFHDCNFSDMNPGSEALTLRLRVRSREPGFCRVRSAFRLVSRFEIKITNFNKKLPNGIKVQAFTFLVSNSFSTKFGVGGKGNYNEATDINQIAFSIQCCEDGVLYVGQLGPDNLHPNTYVTVSFIDSEGIKRPPRNFQAFGFCKFSSNPPLSVIGNKLLIEWLERIDGTLEFGNVSCTHFSTQRNRFDFPYRSEAAAPPSLERREPMFSSGPDFLLQAQTKSIPVHKDLLVQHSDFFRAMLQHDMKEKKEGLVKLDTDAETAERLVKFMYTRVLEKTLQRENIFSLYIAAKMYQIEGLQKDCYSLLTVGQQPSSLFGVLALAAAHHDHRLKTKAQSLICEHREDALNSSEWRLFQESHQPLAKEVLCIVESCSGRKSPSYSN